MKFYNNLITFAVVCFLLGVCTSLSGVYLNLIFRNPVTPGHSYNGVARTYYKNSVSMHTECNYINGVKEGPELAWYPNSGTIKSIQFYRNGKLDGLCLKYELDAEYPFVSGEFKSGLPWDGTFLMKPDGTLETTMNFVSPSSILARDCDFSVYEYSNGVNIGKRKIKGL